MLMFMLFLHLNPPKTRTVCNLVSTFDFFGLFLTTAGFVLLLIVLQGAEVSGWKAAQTLAPLVIGIVLLFVAAFYELYTTRESIVPPCLFHTCTTAGILISALIHAMLFFTASYYVPLYFQILGSSATMACIRQLPYSFGASIISIFSDVVISKTGKYRPWLWIGFVVTTLGNGLVTMLEENTSNS